MAAVAHASSAHIRGMVPVHIGSYVPSAPLRTPVAVYRRRRIAALVVAAGVLAAVVLAVGWLVAAVGANPASASERLPAEAAYVVQPGDTFWDIARRLEPGGDPRPLVSRLVAAHGSPVLMAGERLALPAAA